DAAPLRGLADLLTVAGQDVCHVLGDRKRRNLDRVIANSGGIGQGVFQFPALEDFITNRKFDGLHSQRSLQENRRSFKGVAARVLPASCRQQTPVLNAQSYPFAAGSAQLGPLPAGRWQRVKQPPRTTEGPLSLESG